jgi:hypothetical protein
MVLQIRIRLPTVITAKRLTATTLSVRRSVLHRTAMLCTSTIAVENAVTIGKSKHPGQDPKISRMHSVSSMTGTPTEATCRRAQ